MDLSVSFTVRVKHILIGLVIIGILAVAYGVYEGAEHDRELSSGKQDFKASKAADIKVPDVNDARIIWKSTFNKFYWGVPALNADESTLYLGDSYKDAIPNHFFYAINTADGKVKWSYYLGNESAFPAVIAPDGTIYFASTYVKMLQSKATGTTILYLHALTPEGKLKWEYTIGDTASENNDMLYPALATDGTIYIGGNGLLALTPEGKLKWQYDNEGMRINPAVGSDGTIYVMHRGVNENLLAAINPDGTVKWESAIPSDVQSVGHVSFGNSEIYVTSDKYIYSFSPDGKLKWSYDVSDGQDRITRSPATVASDGTIYLGSKVSYGTGVSSRLFALTPEGKLKWRYETKEPGLDIYSVPLIGADGTIYFGDEGGRFSALNPENGEFRWQIQLGGEGIAWATATMDKNGVIYMPTMDGRLFAIRTDSKGLDSNAPWPKFRGNVQNTGRKE